MEYKEVIRKNGQKVVFCNFEDLLKETCGVKTMEEVERSITKAGDEWVTHCPFCKAEGHTKHKLYIKNDLTVGHCFVCTRAFVNVTDTLKAEVKAPLALTKFGMGPEKFEVPVMKSEEWNLDRFNYEFDDESEVGMNYLLSRHGFFKDLAKALGVKFWNGNVVIPFYNNKNVYYYQIRFVGKSSNTIRYFLPPVTKKSCYIIERFEEEPRHRILIVEGVFDAVAALIQCPDYTPVAVLGSSISDFQIAQIREYAGFVSEVRIWMDETKISLGILKKVRSIIDYCPISIIKSWGPDPEEVLKTRLKYGQPVQWIRSEYVKDDD